MSNNDFTIDDTEIRDMFAELEPKRRKQAFRRATSSSLNVIKKQTVKNLKSNLGASAVNHVDQYNNSLKKGVKVKVNKDCMGGTIHIMGNYKLKWFELGTKNRYNFKKSSSSWSKHKIKGGRYEYRKIKGVSLKKKRFTGHITAYHFFRDARQSTEKLVIQNLDKELAKSVEKINRKYGHRN